MDYIILPQWLCQALKKLGKPLDVALDCDQLKTILSPEEVLFYSITQKCYLLEQSRTFKRFLDTLTSSLYNKMPKGMTHEMSDEEMIQYKLCYDSQTSDEAMTKLFLFGVGQGEPVTHVKLKPVLVGKETLGLIMEVCKEKPEDVVLYEEVFNILQLRYRHDDITSMPLYSGYLQLLDQQLAR